MKVVKRRDDKMKERRQRSEGEKSVEKVPVTKNEEKETTDFIT